MPAQQSAAAACVCLQNKTVCVALRLVPGMLLIVHCATDSTHVSTLLQHQRLEGVVAQVELLEGSIGGRKHGALGRDVVEILSQGSQAQRCLECGQAGRLVGGVVDGAVNGSVGGGEHRELGHGLGNSCGHRLGGLRAGCPCKRARPKPGSDQRSVRMRTPCWHHK